MNNAFARRLGVLTAGVVATAGIAMTGSSAQAAAPGADPAPEQAGAAWLASQVPPSRIIPVSFDTGTFSGEYDDYGLTIDAAEALRGVGGRATLVAEMADAIQSNADDYTGTDGNVSASAAAKLTSFLLEQGRTPTAVSSQVQLVRDSVSTTGRIEDSSTDSETPDYALTIGQIFAVDVLDRAAATEATSATTYLLSQQCQAGFFRGSFTTDKSSPNQSCDADAGTPSVDTTALAVIELQDQAADEPAIAASLDRAVAWLRGAQQPSGGFGAGDGSAPNTNSTGLAGAALGVEGSRGAAESAALWVRGRQLANAGTCTPYAPADNGAVVSDDLAAADAAKAPMDAVARSLGVRAAAQGVPALAYAPGGPSAGETTVTAPASGSTGSVQQVTLTGAPGNTLCVTSGGTSTRVILDGSGRAIRPVTLSGTAGANTVTVVDTGGESDTITVIGIAPAVAVTAKIKDKKVSVGDKVKVQLTGLKPGAKVVTTIRGTKVDKTKATATGTANVKFKLKKVAKPGKATLKIKAAGQPAIKKSIHIVRP